MNRKLIAGGFMLAASYNLSNDSDNFRVNGITDKYLRGLCSIEKDKADAQLEVTCKTGDGEYKKHYLGISDTVTYFVEQMDPASVDTYRYKVQFCPEELLPGVDVHVSGGDK